MKIEKYRGCEYTEYVEVGKTKEKIKDCLRLGLSLAIIAGSIALFAFVFFFLLKPSVKGLSIALIGFLSISCLGFIVGFLVKATWSEGGYTSLFEHKGWGLA